MKRVLIVDDSEFIRKTFLFTLRKRYRCDLAENGARAVELFTQALAQGDPFRFVLTDLCMPSMKGDEAVRAMRRAEAAAGAARDVQAVVLVLSSAGDQPEHRMALSDCRVSEFLTKPVMPRELVEHLERLG